MIKSFKITKTAAAVVAAIRIPVNVAKIVKGHLINLI